MGRYYSGDIKGKFWFGVQNSNDASFFGGQENEPNYINYYFEKEDLSDIKEGIEKCKKELGEFKEKIDAFFSKLDSYNTKQLTKVIKTKEEKANKLLVWYARLLLGEKILKCVEKHDYCEFEAEL